MCRSKVHEEPLGNQLYTQTSKAFLTKSRNGSSAVTDKYFEQPLHYKPYDKSRLRPIFLPLPPDASSNDYWELNYQESIESKSIRAKYKAVNASNKHQEDDIVKKDVKCFDNVNNGMNSSKDSLISCNSNTNSVTNVTATTSKSKENNFVENNQGEDNFEDSSGNDIKDSDSIVNENNFESHTFGPSFKLNKKESNGNSKNNTFDHKEERTRKYNKYNRKAGSKNSNSTASKIPLHSRQGDQEIYNLEPTYGKTAGANSSISATNNHRKNLKLRQQNMDHDYRYDNCNKIIARIDIL